MTLSPGPTDAGLLTNGEGSIMELTITMTLEGIPGRDQPLLVGGIRLQDGMSVLQLKSMMTGASHLIEQKLVDNGLLGIILPTK